MHFTYLTFVLALAAALALAAPPSGYGDQCITRQEASKLVGYYAAVLDHQGTDLGTPEQTVAAIMVPSYKEYSDSANEQIGLPVSYAVRALTLTHLTLMHNRSTQRPLPRELRSQ